MQTQPSGHNPSSNPQHYIGQSNSATNLKLQKRLSGNSHGQARHQQQFMPVPAGKQDDKAMIDASIYSVLNFDNMQQQEFKYEQMMRENWLRNNGGSSDFNMLQQLPQAESERLV